MTVIGLGTPAATSMAGFKHMVRVYWEDTDAGGVVFYANYLKFFERARTEWLRALGIEQQTLRDETHAIFVVTETALHYRAPAKLDDLLQISVVASETGRASMRLQQRAWRPARPGAADPSAATLLCEGSIRIGCVDARNFRPCRFPAAVLAAITTPTLTSFAATP